MRHTYQDCIDHLNNCRAGEELYIKETLVKKGLPEYRWTDFVRLPSLYRIGTMEDDFYNFISIMNNTILDHVWTMCRVAEFYNTMEINMVLKRENVNLKNENKRLSDRVNKGEIYIITSSKGGKIRLTCKKR